MRRRTFVEGLLGAVGIGLSGKALAEATAPEAPASPSVFDHPVMMAEHGCTYDSGTAFSLGTPTDIEMRRRFAIKIRRLYGKWCDPESISQLDSEEGE